MLHFEQRRCERYNREFNRFLTYIKTIFYHVPLYIMMCENKDVIIIITIYNVALKRKAIQIFHDDTHPLNALSIYFRQEGV